MLGYIDSDCIESIHWGEWDTWLWTQNMVLTSLGHLVILRSIPGTEIVDEKLIFNFPDQNQSINWFTGRVLFAVTFSNLLSQRLLGKKKHQTYLDFKVFFKHSRYDIVIRRTPTFSKYSVYQFIYQKEGVILTAHLLFSRHSRIGSFFFWTRLFPIVSLKQNLLMLENITLLKIITYDT